jgi:hypothetical protein
MRRLFASTLEKIENFPRRTYVRIVSSILFSI